MLAKTPVLDYIYATYPKTSLSASGLEVGLDPGDPGNSEVGHLNLGSGRVVWEDLPKINHSIEEGEFYQVPALKEAMSRVRQRGATLHLWGLVSDGGVHAHIEHFGALLKMAAGEGVRNVLVHFITDGRDTAPKQALAFVEQLEAKCNEVGVGRIATVVGRYFAMDRDQNWDRVRKAYDLLVKNSGQQYPTAGEAITAAYDQGNNDEFLEPMVIGEGGVVSPDDSVIMVNYRSDRARQMLDALTVGVNSPGFSVSPFGCFVCTMTRYRKNQVAAVAFEKEIIIDSLADLVAAGGLTQYHVAETEKYAHVTYFLNGGQEKPHNEEAQEIVPSKKVPTYDLAPAMSAGEITEKVKKALDSGYDFIVVNYANGDMVGHTGNLPASIQACEAVDRCLGEVLAEAQKCDYRVIITADHGNCEVMIDATSGGPNKEHTTNPVPFVHLDFSRLPFSPSETQLPLDDYAAYAVSTPVGVLADVAPSVLAILGIEQPMEMSGMDLTIAL
ncbi:MAG: 2,3-bisphosphoglycerate-independent phosphoglycerate mutase [bacterium ADurb.Bin400]|nr:MAG: 2,3-bisphosphoglycerate-independent phosphoglycerate mutase [bacterium ADurb.Bin400]